MTAGSIPHASPQAAAHKPSVDWRSAVEPYVGPDSKHATIQLVTTMLLLSLSIVTAHFAMHWFFPLALLLALPTGGLLIRTFVLMHDCAHGSFFASRKLNEVVGFVTGALTMTPFAQWRRDHALHHASSGDLDRRGHGDVPTLTVREYLQRTPRQRLSYRIVRHPALLLLGGPFYLALGQRFRSRSLATGAKQVTSVWATNAFIAAFLVAFAWIAGWQSLIVTYLVPYYIAALSGVWLFYVQHQFEDAYWAPRDQWDYVEAALRGSSHLQLSPVLRWFTGSIGLHHVHHVAPRIPNYRLQKCHDSNAVFQSSPVMTIRSGASALRLALWDEDRNQLVRFKDVVAS